MIFVFGSNLAGRHGAGAAFYAKSYYGAIYGCGYGPQGNAFAIPTKGKNLEILSLENISTYVDKFITYAYDNLDKKFLITRVGCGLAGYKDREMAHLFAFSPDNCIMPIQWKPFLPDSEQFEYHNEGELV